MRQEFEVLTDHFQLLFGDRVRGPKADTSALWDGGGKVAALRNAPEVVGLATARYGGVTRVQIDVIDDDVVVDESSWTELGKFSVSVPSGKLVLWGPEMEDVSEVPTLSLPCGAYSGRAFSRGVEAVTDEMATSGPDEYRLVLRRVS